MPAIAQRGYNHQLRTNLSETSWYWGLRNKLGFFSYNLTLMNLSVLHDDPFNKGTNYSLLGNVNGAGMGILLISVYSRVLFMDGSSAAREIAIAALFAPFFLANSDMYINIMHIKPKIDRKEYNLQLLLGNRTDYFMFRLDKFWRFSPAVGLEFSIGGKKKDLSGEPEYIQNDPPDDRKGFGIAFGLEKPIDLNEGKFYWRQPVPFVSLRYLLFRKGQS